MSKTVTSKQFSLQGRDWIKTVGIGLAVAVITALWELYKVSGSLDNMTWDGVLQAVIATVIAYLGKNFLEKTKTVTIHEGK